MHAVDMHIHEYASHPTNPCNNMPTHTNSRSCFLAPTRAHTHTHMIACGRTHTCTNAHTHTTYMVAEMSNKLKVLCTMLRRSYRPYLGTCFGFLRLLVHLKHDHSFEKITAALLLYLKLLGLLGWQLNGLQSVKPAGKCHNDTCVCEKGYTTGPACEFLNRAGVCLCCCAFMCLCVCL